MPPRRFSRYEFTLGIRDDDARLFLTDREPFRFRSLPDNRLHEVKEGETIFTIAGRYFRPRSRAAGLWWIIADFQPDPIQDPTIPLDLGRRLFVPSLRTIDEEILSERRRREVQSG
jgi:hypothetical protein